MISNNERREVAENLRNLIIGRFIQYKEQFFDELAETVVGYEDFHDSQADKDALARSLDTIRTALVQPVGATPDAKKRSKRCVTDAEFDRAVMVTIAPAMAMWLSGALEKVEVVSND